MLIVLSEMDDTVTETLHGEFKKTRLINIAGRLAIVPVMRQGDHLIGFLEVSDHELRSYIELLATTDHFA